MLMNDGKLQEKSEDDEDESDGLGEDGDDSGGDRLMQNGGGVDGDDGNSEGYGDEDGVIHSVSYLKTEKGR